MSARDGWSVPNFGVTDAVGVAHMVNLKPGFFVTAVDYGTFATCSILVPRGGFTPAASGEFPSLKEAHEWGERTATSFDCVKGA